MKKTLLLWSIILGMVATVNAKTYEISTESGLLDSFEACAETDTVLITADIVMASTGNKKFMPLCNDENGFRGVFDGQGHTISLLNSSLLAPDDAKNVAFIAVLNGGVIRNIDFDNATLIARVKRVNNGGVSGISVAVVVAKVKSGLIENVNVTNSTVSVRSSSGKSNKVTDANEGGIVGTIESGTIRNCSVSGKIQYYNLDGSSTVDAGGICGEITGDNVVLENNIVNVIDYNGKTLSAIGSGEGNAAFSTSTKYGALTVTATTKSGSTSRTAIIDGAYTAAGSVEIRDDVKVSSVTMDRTFNVNKVATLYVPFDINVNQIEGASVYKFKTVEKVDGRWKFKVSTATQVKANTPYVVLPSSSTITFNVANTVTLNTATEGDTASNGQWEFVGTYRYTTFTYDDDNPVYLFADQERDGAKLGEFVKIADGAFTNPMRAYLVYHKGAALQKSVRSSLGGGIALPDELDIEIENENGEVVQTGTLNTVTGDVRMDRWFDLKGRKLNSRPSVKGSYYRNGKKAIIK